MLVVLGLLFSGANAQLLDDDFWQHARVDSSMGVDSSMQLWLFIMGPNDSGFVNVDRVYQNQAFVITIADSTYLAADTLYFRPDFELIGSTATSLIWTNSYDDNGTPSSGPIDGLVIKARIHNVPGDSITLATWNTGSTVINRHVNDPNDSAWAATLDGGGQPDRATISGLDSTKEYWFAIKLVDEAWNWSLVSNNALKTSATLDSTTTQAYELVTTWNKWDGVMWNTGQASPITRVEITLGVIPTGEAITVNPDGS